METTTRIDLAADGVAMVPSSLRDEIAWRDGSAEADRLKPDPAASVTADHWENRG